MEHNNSQKLMLSARFIYQCVIATFCFSVLFANTSFAQSCEEAIQNAESTCDLEQVSKATYCMNAYGLDDQSYTNPTCSNNDTPTGINTVTQSCFRSAQSCLKSCGYQGVDKFQTQVNPSSSKFLDALIQYKNSSLTDEQKKCLSPAKKLAKYMTADDSVKVASSPKANHGKNACETFNPKNLSTPEATDFKDSCQKMAEFSASSRSYTRNTSPSACKAQGLSWNASENRCWDAHEECSEQGLAFNDATGRCASSDGDDVAPTPITETKPRPIVGGCDKPGFRLIGNQCTDCRPGISHNPACNIANDGKNNIPCNDPNKVRDQNGTCVDPPATCDPTVDTARCSPEQLVNLKEKCEAQGKVWNGKSCDNKVSSAEEDPNDDGEEEEEDAETASPDSPGDQTPGDNEDTNKDLKNLEQALKNASDNLGGGGGGQNSGGGNNGIPNVGSVSVGGNNDGLGSSNFDGGGDDSRSSSELSVSPPSTRSITPLFRGRTPIVGVEQKGQQRADGGGANNQGGNGGLGGNPGGLGGGNKGKPQKVKGAGRRGKSRLWEAAKQLVTGSYFGGGGGGAAAGGNNKYRKTAKRKSKRFLPNGRGGYVDTQGMTGAELNALNKSFRSNIPGYKPAPASHGLLGDKYNRLVTTILKNEVMLNRYGCEPPLTSCDAVKRMTASSKRKRKPSSVRSKKKRTKKRYKKRRKKRRKKRK